MPADAADRQRRAAERRLLAALRRFHRRQPLTHDIRTDALLALVREEDAAPRPPSHRGAGPLLLDDDELRAVVDDLVERGELERSGRRVRLAGQGPRLDAAMRERIDRLLEGLRDAGFEPPRVEAVASRLGVPPALVDGLRRSGHLVSVAPGIDYPREVWQELRARMVRLAQHGPLTIPRVRHELRTSRRYAEAVLDAARREDDRHGPRPRRPGGHDRPR
ncbi:MAG TPA: hypothetical protein VHK06_04910 [Candidatus Limnocylindria bacterium]|nr:hypothetical protein [Candidatus Limnocylindria bacterium]